MTWRGPEAPGAHHPEALARPELAAVRGNGAISIKVCTTFVKSIYASEEGRRLRLGESGVHDKYMSMIQ